MAWTRDRVLLQFNISAFWFERRRVAFLYIYRIWRIICSRSGLFVIHQNYLMSIMERGWQMRWFIWFNLCIWSRAKIYFVFLTFLLKSFLASKLLGFMSISEWTLIDLITAWPRRNFFIRFFLFRKILNSVLMKQRFGSFSFTNIFSSCSSKNRIWFSFMN